MVHIKHSLNISLDIDHGDFTTFVGGAQGLVFVG